VGELDRTLVIVESKELLVGQKRGVASALRKAKKELAKLEKRAAGGRITKTLLEQCVAKALAREHLAEFVMVCIDGEDARPSFSWRVDTRRANSSERALASACSAPTDTPGATSASSTDFAANGTSRSFSDGPRKAASSRGAPHTSGRTPRCGFIHSPPCSGSSS
jgi:hypothetical protein